jgi:WD40 repeat protein
VTSSYDGTLAVWEVRSTPGVSGMQPGLISRWRAHGFPASGTKCRAAPSTSALPNAGHLPQDGACPEVRCVCFCAAEGILVSGGNDCRIRVRYSNLSQTHCCETAMASYMHAVQSVCFLGHQHRVGWLLLVFDAFDVPLIWIQGYLGHFLPSGCKYGCLIHHTLSNTH